MASTQTSQIQVAPDERLIAKVLDGSYDPRGRNYLNSVRDDDPFLYKITKRVVVSRVLTGEVVHYELYGRPVGMRPAWRERMEAKGETLIAKVRSNQYDPQALYLNSEDGDDPYVYTLTRIETWRRGQAIWYQFYGLPADVKEEWKRVVRLAGGEVEDAPRRPGRKRSRPASELCAVLGVSVGADRVTVRRAYRRLARELHPDVNQASDATARFQEVQLAYDELMVLLPDA